MKEKKKLKKLTLKKEAVVNLNDYEMNNLIGGSGWACAASVSATIASAIGIYQVGKDESVWRCDVKQPSERFMWIDGQQHCMIDEVVVYGWQP